MKVDTATFESKSKLLLVYAVLSCFLLVSNVVSWNKEIYAFMDRIFNPFLVNFRKSASDFSFVIHEMNNKDDVLRENLELKRKLLQYEEIKVTNNNLTEQIKRLETQTGIRKISEKSLRMVNIVGAQNVFSSNPELVIRTGQKDNVKVNDTVFYESNTLLGFVFDVSEESSKVLPFYSPSMNFKIPAQNLRIPDQKGFITPISGGVVKIMNVPLNAEVLEGDIWITTNDVPEVMPNLVLGKAKKITKNTETGFQEIELEIPFDFNKTTYVFVEE